MEIKLGDLVRLRNDLEDCKSYDDITFTDYMNFKGFRKVIVVFKDNKFRVAGKEIFLYNKEMIAEVKKPCKYETIYKRKEPILDKEEREYLSAVIKPFRNRINYIVKRKYELSNKERILIIYDGEPAFMLPDFKKGNMYKGMELERKYTLEELGL